MYMFIYIIRFPEFKYQNFGHITNKLKKFFCSFLFCFKIAILFYLHLFTCVVTFFNENI